ISVETARDDKSLVLLLRHRTVPKRIHRFMQKLRIQSDAPELRDRVLVLEEYVIPLVAEETHAAHVGRRVSPPGDPRPDPESLQRCERVVAQRLRQREDEMRSEATSCLEKPAFLESRSVRNDA